MTILCKAKRIDNGEWVEGYLFETKDNSYIAYDGQFDDDLFLSPKNIFIPIAKDTVCRFAGLFDKNGQKIWENDICKYFNPEDKDGVAIIKHDHVRWIFGTISQKELLTPLFYLQCGDEWEVIGNVFDNPELVQGVPEQDIERE